MKLHSIEGDLSFMSFAIVILISFNAYHDNLIQGLGLFIIG